MALIRKQYKRLQRWKNYLLLDDWFILVAAALRFLFPTRRTFAASSALCILTHLRSTAYKGITQSHTAWLY